MKHIQPWNKGVPMSEEQKIKLRGHRIQQAQRECATCHKHFTVQPSRLKYSKCEYCSKECMVPWNKGKKGAQAAWNKGRPISEDQKVKLRGPRPHTRVIGTDKRKERHMEMARYEYKEWRKAVFEKNNYSCVLCGVIGGKLEADHIKPWAIFPDERYNVSNGRTLCKSCHRGTDTWGRKSIYREKAL